VLALGEQAFASGLHAGDPIEWLPFLQAYAQDGRTDRFEEIGGLINEDLFVRAQFCNSLLGLSNLEADVLQAVSVFFCSEQ
jgi:hypothetical protein